ncbi:MAG: hypothetical protein Q9M24_07475 [Mariprofundaceae bacterium]|nr:hypothetical protein [Mariprofundaceae bacterium]
MRRFRLTGLLASMPMLAIPAQTAPAFQEGEWQITTQTEIPGMPFTPPAVTMRQCLTLKDRILPGKDKQYIDDVINELTQMAEQLESVHEDAQLVARRSLEAQLRHAEAYFTKGTTEASSMRILSFATILMQMQRVLKAATVQSS